MAYRCEDAPVDVACEGTASRQAEITTASTAISPLRMSPPRRPSGTGRG